MLWPIEHPSTAPGATGTRELLDMLFVRLPVEIIRQEWSSMKHITRAIVTPLAAAPLALGVLQAPSASAAAGGSCAVSADTGRSVCAASIATATREIRAIEGTAAAYTLAEFYENINYGGGVLRIVGSSCTATYSDKEYTIADLTTRFIRTGVTWNDRISSLRTYHSCDARLYQDTHGGGSQTGWIDSNSDLRSYTTGNWNDRASSIRLS